MNHWSDTLYLVGAVVGLTVVTFVTRAGMFVLSPRVELPAWLTRALRYAPGCALAAVVAPGVLAPGGEVTIGWRNPALWAVVAAALLFARTRNMALTTVVGFTVFTVLRLWW